MVYQHSRCCATSADMSCAAHEYLGQRRLRQPSCAHRPCSLWPRAPWHTGFGAHAPAACTPTSADATPPGPALVLPSSAPVALEPAPQACRQQAVLAAAPQHRATREGSTAPWSAEVESGRLFAAAGAPRVASTILPHPPHPLITARTMRPAISQLKNPWRAFY